MAKLKVMALVAIFSLLFTGCSSPSSPKPKPTQTIKNEWVRACKRYTPDTGVDYLIAYNQVIADVCAKADPDKRDAPAVLSPTVNRQDAERYLNAEKFFESYWSNYMGPDFPAKYRVIFSEKDQQWWEAKMKENILHPNLGWFTSKNEGGHCRVEPDIFCPKLFSRAETTTNTPTEFRIIGSKLQWDDWRVLNSAHEMVHLYQDSQGMSHWAYWYVEGQATFYELAMSQLLFGTNAVRREYLVARPARQDTYKFDATTPREVVAFVDKCSRSQNGECDAFKYGIGSMYHEKLVIDFGLQKYYAWQLLLAERMPKGNPANFNAQKSRIVSETFASCFESTFGIKLKKWEDTVAAPYLLKYYK